MLLLFVILAIIVFGFGTVVKASLLAILLICGLLLLTGAFLNQRG